MSTETTAPVVLKTTEGHVGLIMLSRPNALNALSRQLTSELSQAFAEMEGNPDIRCIIITGSEKVFSAGADIKEFGNRSGSSDISTRFTTSIWLQLRRSRKPVIAAVSGYAFGGGCELALACDMIVASETAKFGQPEINIGIIPGAGGTQRWTRIVGKQRAMEINLTGNPIDARTALAWGIVNRVVPVESFLDEAKRLANEIASKAPLAVQAAKEAVIKSEDVSLEIGLDFEQSVFR